MLAGTSQTSVPYFFPDFSAASQQNQQPVGGAAPTGDTAGGQLSVPSGINESQLQKVYAALGLPYQGFQ